MSILYKHADIKPLHYLTRSFPVKQSDYFKNGTPCCQMLNGHMKMQYKNTANDKKLPVLGLRNKTANRDLTFHIREQFL